jgi:hypothetical protein
VKAIFIRVTGGMENGSGNKTGKRSWREYPKYEKA